MAKQIEGVYETVLVCARAEFLEKGYTDASLREIAAKANTTTGSIYTRFGDKEGLFRAIVEPAAQGMKELFVEIQKTFHAFDAESQRQQMGKYTADGMNRILDLIYADFDAFRLLLDASYGTLYQSFVNELVDIEVEYTDRFMQVMGMESAVSEKITRDMIHIVVTAYMNGMFEVVRHRFTREEAGNYISMLNRYHRAGFCTIFGFPID
ncbi:MAG: TetR/AcrR family transcriptional regulator [Lachnospiraceae bacterium]|nr:TetR/AcrR family transcriptional regulator [Lachnospiraceae bacterium]